MPPARRPPTEAADALVAVAPLVSRWIERLLARHDPSLTVAQILALRAIAAEAVCGSELAARTGLSGPAVSQPLPRLADACLFGRHDLIVGHLRPTLSLPS